MCSPMLKKIFCAEFAPPCFPDDKTEIVLRTVCKSACENVREECPELYREHFGEYSYCEQMGTAKSNMKGFCELTKWPTAVRWPSRPSVTSKLLYSVITSFGDEKSVKFIVPVSVNFPFSLNLISSRTKMCLRVLI